MTTRLVLMRHGQTINNANKVIDTRPPGAELTELGKTQAIEAGTELHKYCGDRISRAYCSVAIRAQQTVELTLASYAGLRGSEKANIPISVVPGIHEIDLGELEGKNSAHAYQSYYDHLAGWLRKDPSVRVPEGENYEELMQRYQPALESILAESAEDADEDVLVVSHGGAIRIVSTLATGVASDSALDAYIPNCGFVILAPNGKQFGHWDVDFWAGHDGVLM